jgi:hypothetical protein
MAMKRMTALLALCLAASGCATMFEHPYQSVSLQSIPDGASYELMRSGDPTVIQQGATPASLHLKRGNGWFRSAKYTVHVWKDGYEPQTFEFPTSVNANYWWNLPMAIVVTGWPVVAMLIVDPLTGAMYDIDVPRAVVLAKKPAEPVAGPEPSASSH